MSYNKDPRSILAADSVITLKRIGTSEKRDSIVDFTITGEAGRGASAICYAAETDGTSGRLKEFYPLTEDEYRLRRTGNHQLTVDESLLFGEKAYRAFEGDCDELVESYRLLQETRKSVPTLNNYIPSFELYEGADIEGGKRGSVYVWTANDKHIITFSDYLSKRVAPDVEDEKNGAAHLLNILDAILNLTKCIRVLNDHGILHLDVKPDNFGIALEGKEVNSAVISLFDVNSMTYVGRSRPLHCLGTDGFRPKELREGNPKVNTDLYAIGATLFHALMAPGGGEYIHYRDDDHGALARILATSRILSISDMTSNTRLFDILLDILSKSLESAHAKRYPGTGYDGLVEDLCNAIYILFPEAQKQRLEELGVQVKDEDKTKLKDIEKECDEQIKTGAAGAIQRLLLEKPLYRYGSAESMGQILVIGSGTYAQKFIDIALETSQVKGAFPRVTVISDEGQKAKARYLNARPAFRKFFTVNGAHATDDEPYGELTFGPSAIFDRGDTEDNREIAREIFRENPAGYAYIFIALGNDELNRCVAETLAELTEPLGHNTLVSFVQYKPSRLARKIEKAHPNASPVFVNDVITGASDYDALYRMAFNCHILWNNTLNLNIEKEEKKFRRPYHFNSSFSSILSIRYKLHSMGIELEDFSPVSVCRAAEEAERALRNLSNLGELAMYEHRRWITNCICAGWDSLSEFSELSAATKDVVGKRHPCIVPCTAEWTLNKAEWNENGKARWDAAGDDITAELDPLDTVSVNLHRHFMQEAKNADTSSLFDEMEDLIDRLHDYPRVKSIMQAFFASVAEIVTERSRYLRLYRFHRTGLEEALDEIPAKVRDAVLAKLKIVDTIMFPILESRKYVDYKATDLTLVRNIPFILTYSTDIRLCIPFAVESKGEKNNRIPFSNVTAALTLNPEHITYIIDTDDFLDDLGRFKKTLAFAVSTMDTRQMRTKLDLVFLRSHIAPLTYDDLLATKGISPRIGNVELIEYADDGELCERVTQYFESRRRAIESGKRGRRRAFSAIEKNGTGTSKLLRGFGCYAKYPCYTLNPSEDRSAPRFLTENGCEHFNYIRFDERILISELFTSQSVVGGAQPPELPDYDTFWQEYHTADPNDTHTKNEKAWKTLCSVLGAYADAHDRLGRIEIPKHDETELCPHRFLIPELAYAGARHILDEIRALHPHCLGENPSVTYYTSDTCEINVVCSEETFSTLQTIFSNPYYLCEPAKLRVEKRIEDGRIWAVVYFDNLRVTGLDAKVLRDAFPKYAERPFEILARLHGKGKLIDYLHDPATDTVSFCYASSRIKEVMTTEGRILELYVYYKALEQNYFDDIVCSYTISDEDHVTNEFDLILTKGFKTMIVECKARPTLEQAFYHKLAGLNRQFGINSTAVLIADTLEKPWWDTDANDLQRTRGRKYNIRTVYKQEDITDIGAKLRRIMESAE